MNLRRTANSLVFAAMAALAVSGPALASDKVTNTLLGAGLGAAGGALLSEGDPLITVAGAAAGGVLGNVLTEDKPDRRWREKSHYKEPKRRYVEKRHGRGKGHHKHHHRHR